MRKHFRVPIVILLWALFSIFVADKVRYLWHIIVCAPFITFVIVFTLWQLAAAAIEYFKPGSRLVFDLPHLMIYSYQEVRDDTGVNS